MVLQFHQNNTSLSMKRNLLRSMLGVMAIMAAFSSSRATTPRAELAMRMVEPALELNSAPMPVIKAGRHTAKVTIDFKTSSEFEQVRKIYMYDYSDPTVRYSLDKYKFEAPLSDYYFVTLFQDMMTMAVKIVVTDPVKVEGETLVTIDSSTADNLISFKAIGPDGQEMKVDKVNGETGEVLEEGNVRSVECHTGIYRKGVMLVAAMSFVAQYSRQYWPGDGDVDLNSDFYINDLSDDYQAAAIMDITDKNGTVHILSLTVPETVNKSCEISNKAEDWKKIDMNFAEFPDAKNKLEPGVWCQYGFFASYNAQDMDGVGRRRTSYVLNPEYYYLSAPEPTKCGVDQFQLYTIGGIPVLDNGQSGASRDFYGLSMPPISEVDGKVHFNVYHHNEMGVTTVGSQEVGGTDFFIGQKYNFHPRFSWDIEEAINPVFGNNVPILYTEMIWSDDFLTNYFSNTFIGRYGEVRFCDSEVATGVFDVNGMAVKRGTVSDLDSFSYSWMQNVPKDAECRIRIDDNNILIDDNIPGSLHTVMEFNTGRTDAVPPTLTMLNFRNKEDKITDRFESNDGTVEFSAADMVPKQNEKTIKWFEANESLKVSLQYSPDGSDVWSSLEVKEVPELFFLPGYGNFYRASLSGVTATSENGWFKLRIRLEDEAGNTQEQTIEPAFYIEKLVGAVQALEESADFQVDTKDGCVKVVGAENPTIEIYGLDGRKLQSGVSTELKIDTNTEIIIVKVFDKSGTIIRKVVQ